MPKKNFLVQKSRVSGKVWSAGGYGYQPTGKPKIEVLGYSDTRFCDSCKEPFERVRVFYPENISITITGRQVEFFRHLCGGYHSE